MKKIYGSFIVATVAALMWAITGPRSVVHGRVSAPGDAGAAKNNGRESGAAPAVCVVDEKALTCLSCTGLCPAEDFQEVVTHLKNRTLSFAIAIVPDPAHTHLGLFFDRQIEAISQGIQESGYVFERAQMPWT